MSPEAIHPDLRSVARWLPRAAVGRRSLKVIRLGTALLSRRSSPGVEVTEVGAISVRVHRPVPSEGPMAALLWIHGGGYVMGSAAQDDAMCRHYADALGIVVVAVEYRLAPEHPFPGPLQDCYDALAWMASQPGIDPTRLAVGGASAGGGLAAALALMAHEKGEIKLAFQMLAYPMLDDRTANRTDVDETGFRLWNNKANRFGWLAYAGREPGAVEISGLNAPSRYDDLSGLPPTWIGVGTLDLFHDEDVAYADRLRAAGVECHLHIAPGAFHGFDVVRPKADVALEFRASQVGTLSAVLGGSDRD